MNSTKAVIYNVTILKQEKYGLTPTPSKSIKSDTLAKQEKTVMFVNIRFQ